MWFILSSSKIRVTKRVKGIHHSYTRVFSLHVKQKEGKKGCVSHFTRVPSTQTKEEKRCVCLISLAFFYSVALLALRFINAIHFGLSSFSNCPSSTTRRVCARSTYVGVCILSRVGPRNFTYRYIYIYVSPHHRQHRRHHLHWLSFYAPHAQDDHRAQMGT